MRDPHAEQPAAARIDGRWAGTAVLGLILAGVGHVLAALDHLSHDVRFAVFFLAVGLGQLVVGSGMRRSARTPTVSATLAVTVSLLLLYLVSRTVALELGPHGDRPESADVLGTAVVIAELAALVALPALLPARARRIAVNAILAVGVAVWVSWITGITG